CNSNIVVVFDIVGANPDCGNAHTQRIPAPRAACAGHPGSGTCDADSGTSLCCSPRRWAVEVPCDSSCASESLPVGGAGSPGEGCSAAAHIQVAVHRSICCRLHVCAVAYHLASRAAISHNGVFVLLFVSVWIYDRTADPTAGPGSRGHCER